MNRVKLALVLAILVHIASFVLMLQKVEPIYSNFYTFAWWTYIVAVAAVNHLKARNSLLFDRPVEAAWVILFSIPFWLFFEVCNFRLDNWNYVGVPIARSARWPGYAVAFATVLPGLFETEKLLENLRIVRKLTARAVRVGTRLLVRMLALGVLMMIGSLVIPQFMFPFVWLGLIFLLDPLLYWSPGGRQSSFSGQAGRGEYGLLVRLLLAGLVCGLLWELWNYWAGAKWIYSVPKLGFWKLFEMPTLGFLGFPPFALESYLCYRLFALYRDRYVSGRLVPQMLLIVIAAIYCVLVFTGIDRYNVWTYKV